MRALSLALMAFLWAPLVAVAVASFNASRYGAVWGGFTLDWYRSLPSNEAAMRALGNTLILALSSTVVATALGTLLGYGLARHRFRGRAVVDRMLPLPMLMPDVVFAVALATFFAFLRSWIPGMEPGMGMMIVGHVSFQVPFVALVVRARTAGLDPALREAARDLGATRWQTFRHVTLPLLGPGVVAGALLAFTLSLDDFAVSFFTSGPGSTTLPILIYASARRGVTPEIHALSTLLMALIVTVVLIMKWRPEWGSGKS